MAFHQFTTLAGQSAIISRSSRPSTNRLLVFCHGGMSLNEEWQVQTNDATLWVTQKMKDLTNYLVDRGFAVVTPALFDTALTFPGTTMGNNPSTTQLDAVITAAKALPGISSGKHGFMSWSMGANTILNWIRRFGQTNLAGTLMFLPNVGALSVGRGTDAAQGSGYGLVNNAFAALAASLATTTNDAFFNTSVYPVYDPPVIAPTLTKPVGLFTNADDLTTPPSLSDSFAALMPNGLATRFNMGTSSGLNSGHNFERIPSKESHEYLSTLNWG